MQTWVDKGRALSLAAAAQWQAVKVRVSRRAPAISGHITEIIWVAIVVIVGIVAYTFFSGTGSDWVHNILNSITQFNS